MRNLRVVRRGLAAATLSVATLSVMTVVQTGPVLADEMWDTNWGVVAYAEDIGSMAVLTYDGGAFFIDGLGGNYTSRGTYTGYWMEYDGAGIACDVPAYDPYGNELWDWGFIEVTFTDPGYPARWEAVYTVCDGPIEGTISANPM